jgi:transketolase
VVVDNNQISMLGPTDSIVSHRDLAAKLSSFGWSAINVVNGHDVRELGEALRVERVAGQPLMIIANTRKGHRVPGLENADLSHVTAIKSELIDELLGELL